MVETGSRAKYRRRDDADLLPDDGPVRVVRAPLSFVIKNKNTGTVTYTRSCMDVTHSIDVLTEQGLAIPIQVTGYRISVE